MAGQNSEQELAKVKLHWGIFIPALLVLTALSFLGLVWLVAMRLLFHIASQFSLEGHPAVPPFFEGAYFLCFLPAILIGGIALLATWFAYSHSEIVLTNHRLIFRAGFLSRMAGELPLQNVETIFIIEPLFGRIFGYGTVLVTSLGGTRFPFHHIGSPRLFHAKLQTAVADAKRGEKSIPKSAVAQQVDDSRYMPKTS